MKYRELLEEYRGLLDQYRGILLALSELPTGCVTKKRISGKTYFYHQYTVHGRRKTEYLRFQEAEQVAAALRRGEQLRGEQQTVEAELSRLQEAVKILCPPMSRTFLFARQCAQMDALPPDRRRKALSFAEALTALEGLAAREETDRDLAAWAAGEGTFTDIYMTALMRCGVLEVPYEA